MKHKYKIVLEFETEEPLTEDDSNAISGACYVQLNTLEDGDLDSGNVYTVNNSDVDMEEVK